MGEEILKDWQRQTVAHIAATPAVRDSFYLTGGTALAAYYLKHRFSDDLDFFTAQAVDAVGIHAIAENVRKVIEAESVRFSRLHDRYQFYYLLGDEEVKVEFTHYPFPQLEEPKEFDGIRVDGIYDIATNKLMAALDRFDPKDFVDLYFLIPQFPLSELRLAVEKKFGIRVDPIFLGSELAKARRIAALPKMIKQFSIEELKDFFAREAGTLESEIVE